MRDRRPRTRIFVLWHRYRDLPASLRLGSEGRRGHELVEHASRVAARGDQQAGAALATTTYRRSGPNLLSRMSGTVRQSGRFSIEPNLGLIRLNGCLGADG
jgi:hypothetical protein